MRNWSVDEVHHTTWFLFLVVVFIFSFFTEDSISDTVKQCLLVAIGGKFSFLRPIGFHCQQEDYKLPPHLDQAPYLQVILQMEIQV